MNPKSPPKDAVARIAVERPLRPRQETTGWHTEPTRETIASIGDEKVSRLILAQVYGAGLQSA